TSSITEYKQFLLSEYAYITEYTSRASEQVLLNDHYIDPLIVQKRREKKERENEMCSRGKRFFNTREPNQRNKNIMVDQLFGPKNGSKKVKKFKELNGLSGEMSLVDLLECSLTPDEIVQILKDIPQMILFIIDGFDELMLSVTKESLPPKPDIKSHPLAIVCSLLKGRMMRESFLLVTTRSSAVDKLENILKKPQCFVEIMGFSEKGVSEYFRKFFEDEEFSSQVYEQAKIHKMLYTACFIPVICWIICTIFKKKGKDGVVTGELTTTTSIFVDFVFTLLKHHSSLNQHEELDLLKNLGQIAESGTPKHQVLFSRNDLPKAISDLPNIPFLCTFRQQERTYLKEMFGFLHLSFQEFFTALFYMLTDKAGTKIKVKELLESAGNEHLLPVIQFLFGLEQESEPFNPRRTSKVDNNHVLSWRNGLARL
ncbi:NACHT, LRR and PYD domains-containing protein 3-like, partial [Sinocyclocheilus rhinocerous]|uniref:NACHT, LRR and PYD domains-containing protein 3-like n=1 Tax=Sinocyclocheilus rhinocerous TaxID=307959 RepID=UPI0007B9E223